MFFKSIKSISVHVYMYGVMVTVVKNRNGFSSSNHGRNCFLSHSTNTFKKGMNPIILSLAIGKIVGQTGFINFSIATSSGERKL